MHHYYAVRLYFKSDPVFKLLKTIYVGLISMQQTNHIINIQ